MQLLFELLDVGGHLVILEAGNPYGSHTVRTARQLVLDIFNNVDKNGNFDASPKYAENMEFNAKKQKNKESEGKKEAARFDMDAYNRFQCAFTTIVHFVFDET